MTGKSLVNQSLTGLGNQSWKWLGELSSFFCLTLLPWRVWVLLLQPKWWQMSPSKFFTLVTCLSIVNQSSIEDRCTLAFAWCVLHISVPTVCDIGRTFGVNLWLKVLPKIFGEKFSNFSINRLGPSALQIRRRGRERIFLWAYIKCKWNLTLCRYRGVRIFPWINDFLVLITFRNETRSDFGHFTLILSWKWSKNCHCNRIFVTVTTWNLLVIVVREWLKVSLYPPRILSKSQE